MECAEVAILNEVISSHSTIHAGTKHSISLLWQELECRDLSRVLREGNETESILDCPELHLTVITTCRDQGSIRRVCHRVEVKEMSLLLENVGLTLPFPYKELTLLFAAHSDPVCLCIDGDAVNFVGRDLE